MCGVFENGTAPVVGQGRCVEFNVAATYFPTNGHRSIIGPLELNGRVRDGNGCDLQGIAATKAKKGCIKVRDACVMHPDVID